MRSASGRRPRWTVRRSILFLCALRWFTTTLSRRARRVSATAARACSADWSVLSLFQPLGVDDVVHRQHRSAQLERGLICANVRSGRAATSVVSLAQDPVRIGAFLPESRCWGHGSFGWCRGSRGHPPGRRIPQLPRDPLSGPPAHPAIHDRFRSIDREGFQTLSANPDNRAGEGSIQRARAGGCRGFRPRREKRFPRFRSTAE
jgi:hypothetical protein